jgi:hypothetical protein
MNPISKPINAVSRKQTHLGRVASVVGITGLLFTLCASAQSSGTFSPTGSLPNALRNAAMTVLPSNLVLVAGGIESSSRLTSISIYNPGSGVFSDAGDMDAPYDTATVLDDGKVLLTGAGNFISLGSNDSVLTSAELYDPSIGGFTSTGPVLEGVSSAATVRLSDGRVLMVGGKIYNHSGAPTADAEIYDPASGAFTFTGSMSTPRYDHTATLLQNGEVLIAGGSSSSVTNAPLASAELYDPKTGSFTPIGGMTTAHANHTATLLADGRVLIAGGFNQPSTAANSVTSIAELYSPSTETFSLTGRMQSRREFHRAIGLASGEVLIAGGDDSFNILPSAELYDPTNGTFVSTSAMKVPRNNFIAAMLNDGDVLVAGGLTSFNEGASTAIAELYIP